MSGLRHPALRDVWESIRTQPGRVGLSFLAVSIGILALTFLLAVTGGLRERARTLVQELGAHVVAILPPENSAPDSLSTLKGIHASLLSRNLPGRLVTAIKRFSVKFEGSDQAVSVIATDHQLAAVRRWPLAAGRFIDPRDVLNADRFAVITRALSARMDWNVGSTINLQGTPFVVVGVLDAGGTSTENESVDSRVLVGDDTVFVPHTVMAAWTPSLTGDARVLDAIFVQGRAEESLPGLVDLCRRLLTAPDQRADALNWITPETLLRGIRRLQQTIGFSVGSIAALCLILGGTTLMSLMLANVRDRVSEIGLRRALGATARDIALLFVLEACAITLAAAAAGTVIAVVLLAFADAFMPAPLRFSIGTFMVPVLASLLLGAIFSYWPARVAAQVAPAEALRSE